MDKFLKCLGWTYLIIGVVLMSTVYTMAPYISMIGIILLMFGWPFWLIIGYLATQQVYPFGLNFYNWVEAIMFTKNASVVHWTSSIINMLGLMALALGVVTIFQSIVIVITITTKIIQSAINNSKAD
jgi:hypothetical protein